MSDAARPVKPGAILGPTMDAEIRITGEPSKTGDRCTFTVDRPVLAGESAHFSAANASHSPLAADLLAIPGVEGALLAENTVTVTASLMLAVYAIVNGNQNGWTSAETVGLLAGAAVLLAGFLVIEARPSGKSVRRLSLLSGGERSLTALAFLFAVFRARPTPFYILDEVEAALDDVNLCRFVDLIQEFRDEAQLLVVSHQKRTMEAADCLYGVTMQPGGSSRVLSERVAAGR